VHAHEAAVRGLVVLLLERHRSRPLGGFDVGQLGPDQVPVLWAQIAPSDTCVTFNGNAVLNRDLTPVLFPLPDSSFSDSEGGSHGLL
jgi:hypothetical protein